MESNPPSAKVPDRHSTSPFRRRRLLALRRRSGVEISVPRPLLGADPHAQVLAAEAPPDTRLDDSPTEGARHLATIPRRFAGASSYI
jgi:hypothetical protein